jgi:hypothetical protein
MNTVCFLGPNLSEGTEIPVLLFKFDMNFVYKKNFHVASSVWMNESYFCTWLPCLLSSIHTSTMHPRHPTVQKAKMLPNFLNTPFWKKRMDHPPWKMSLFAGHEFSCKRDSKPFFKFHMETVVLLIYRMLSSMLCVDGQMTDFCAIRTSRCFGAECRAQSSIQYRYTSCLVSFDRSTFSLVVCGVWRWVILFGFRKTGQLVTNIYNWEIVKFL